jgi:hypothetical protein
VAGGPYEQPVRDLAHDIKYVSKQRNDVAHRGGGRWELRRGGPLLPTEPHQGRQEEDQREAGATGAAWLLRTADVLRFGAASLETPTAEILTSAATRNFDRALMLVSFLANEVSTRKHFVDPHPFSYGRVRSVNLGVIRLLEIWCERHRLCGANGPPGGLTEIRPRLGPG